jgi:CubicO group peptidase (beta-lactamase class C family)
MVLTAGNPEDAGVNPEKIEKISTILSSWVENGITASQCALVARKGKIILKEAHGYLDNRNTTEKLTTDAIFPLASISKPLTAACLMLLMDDGLVDASNKVNTFIPEFSGTHKEAVSVHHCLTHTAGFDEEEIRKFQVPSKELSAVPENQHPAVHENLHKIYQCPLQNEPGILMR